MFAMSILGTLSRVLAIPPCSTRARAERRPPTAAALPSQRRLRNEMCRMPSSSNSSDTAWAKTLESLQHARNHVLLTISNFGAQTREQTHAEDAHGSLCMEVDREVAAGMTVPARAIQHRLKRAPVPRRPRDATTSGRRAAPGSWRWPPGFKFQPGEFRWSMSLLPCSDLQGFRPRLKAFWGNRTPRMIL